MHSSDHEAKKEIPKLTSTPKKTKKPKDRLFNYFPPLGGAWSLGGDWSLGGARSLGGAKEHHIEVEQANYCS